jgi:hypothetical protein
MNTGIDTYTSDQVFPKLVCFSGAQNVMLYLLTHILTCCMEQSPS